MALWDSEENKKHLKMQHTRKRRKWTVPKFSLCSPLKGHQKYTRKSNTAEIADSGNGRWPTFSGVLRFRVLFSACWEFPEKGRQIREFWYVWILGPRYESYYREPPDVGLALTALSRVPPHPPIAIAPHLPGSLCDVPEGGAQAGAWEVSQGASRWRGKAPQTAFGARPTSGGTQYCKFACLTQVLS